MRTSHQNFVINQFDCIDACFFRISNKSFFNQVLYDEQGIPLPELDGSIHDIFAEGILYVYLNAIDDFSTI